MSIRHFNLDDDTVVVVIGSGAGGGTLANELAQKGIDVVCLEAGSRIDLSDIVNDEAKMFPKVTWLDQRTGNGDVIPSFPAWTCKTVGGTTFHWTGVCPRFQDYELKPASTYGTMPGTNYIDWPLTYEELLPFYEKAEQKMGVTGRNGRPKLPANNNCKVMIAGAQKLGYTSVSTGHHAINSVEFDNRPSCQQTGFCLSGCVYGAKWSTLYTEIPKAEETGHFELRPQSMAVRITHDKEGKVNGVDYLDSTGILKHQKARIVSVAANAIETARILLNSSTEKYPSGLGNGNDLVGRHYMRQFTNMVMSVMPGPVNFHRGTVVGGLISDEARHDPSRGFSSGYLIMPVALSPESLTVNAFPGLWGKDLADALSNYTNFAGLLMLGEDPPELTNRITLHKDQKDHHGLPVPHIHYKEHDNTKAMRKHAMQRGIDLHSAVGALNSYEIWNVPAGHNLGTARMSGSPKTGVCDKWGSVFGHENLFISDGSSFCSSAAENPTLTIVSLAIRQAEYIARNIKTGTL
ncbi:MAG: 2-keto-gluconate dehydrogenase [Alphaproteobacteria bacterium]|nr:MAG: 2-keto-gluconate dehydrogenase [Alphaproteobacteria bacterium]